MKRTFTLYILTSIFIFCGLLNVSAQDPVYTEVLYRVNAGGYTLTANELDWDDDDFSSPSPYVTVQQTQVYSDKSMPVTIDASVPAGTPDSIFYYERNTGNGVEDTMRWDFPVEAGNNLKINLYFSEIYHTAVGERVFDVAIDKVVVLDNYDILADVGENVGVMKSFTIISDGNVDIDFIRDVSWAKVSAIEILAEPAVVEGNATAMSRMYSISPNPVSEKLVLTGKPAEVNFTLVSATGQIQNVSFSETGNGYAADASALEKGVYILYINSPKNREVIRFLKK